MKLAILTPQLPYPPHQGTTIRNFNILKHLAPRHEITLISFGTFQELENAEPLRTLCQRIEIAPYPTRTMMQRAIATFTSTQPDMALRLKSDDMHSIVELVLQQEPFDVVQVEGIEMARYVPPLAPHLSPLVFDDHNAEYVLQRTAFESDSRRITRWHTALYSFIQWKKLARYECSVCLRANRVVACSDTDAGAIQSLIPNLKSKISVIPNGVDTDFFVLSDEVCAKPLAEFGMVYAGKMDFRPNIDAMTWFCDDILPRIRANIPLAHITIVGQKPAPKISALEERPGVEVTGWVDDTRPFIADAPVYIVPLRMGSGTRLKVLEAMAMGKAIVSTSRGVEGIDLVAERDAVIANSADEFAHQVIALLHNPKRRRDLGNNARVLVEAKYDWRKIVPRFEQVYRMTNAE